MRDYARALGESDGYPVSRRAPGGMSSCRSDGSTLVVPCGKVQGEVRQRTADAAANCDALYSFVILM